MCFGVWNPNQQRREARRSGRAILINGSGTPSVAVEGRGSLSEALAATFASTNLPSLLRYEDRNSMAHYIESRVPFLTPDFAEFVLRLPEEHILANDGTTKSVFRAAMRGIVPA